MFIVATDGGRRAQGSVVAAGAVIGVRAHLGRGCIVNTCASVDHDVRLGDWVHVAPGAHIVVVCLATFLRAHKRELLMPASVAASLSCGVMTLILGRVAGATGVSLSYAIAMGVVALPIALVIWARVQAAATSELETSPPG